MTGRKSIALTGLALLTTLGVAACGESHAPSAQHESSTEALVTPTAKQSNSSAAKGPTVAHVKGTPILKADYEHWLTVDNAMGVSGNPGHHALGFLITSSWVLGEAVGRKVSVTAAEVSKRLANLEQKSFPKSGELGKYLKKTHQTKADLQARVKIELLESRIAEEVTQGKSSKAQRKAALASFQQSFEKRWKAVTSCKAAYVMEDCREYKGAPEAPASSSSTSSPSGGESSSSTASSSGEVYTAPGAFALSSPAFERNSEIPAKYTCNGAGVSPPLEWEKVPKGATELVLFVIDDSSDGSEGGIRWIVAGINPSSKGVAAGQLPEGAVVGTNTAGKATYSPICPAPGHTDTVEFVMYALKHPISLSNGFQPSIAEHDYGSTKDLLGQSAVTYAVAHGS
ncbi:MAG TPA: YbhB/YbcL family Raf kinase inhibitor-like protein [Solirubrobacteraceae bacterium]|jgi:hypothetical protein